MKTDPNLSGKASGGRPRKFAEPSRPITLTLPESTLRELRGIHPDRGHAIVKLAKMALPDNTAAQPLVEIVELAPNTGLVIIGPSHALRQIPFLHLVEVAPARYLLAMDPGHDFESLEIALNDILDNVPGREKKERELVVRLLDHIRNLRRTDRMRMAEIIFVSLARNTNNNGAKRRRPTKK